MSTDNFIPHGFYQLRVKRAHLAQEARIIRRLELNRLKRARNIEHKYPAAEGETVRLNNARVDYLSMNTHRRNTVRPEARATHVAAMFLKGVALNKVEDPARKQTDPDWTRVEAIVGSFASGDKRQVLQRLAEWRDAGNQQA